MCAESAADACSNAFDSTAMICAEGKAYSMPCIAQQTFWMLAACSLTRWEDACSTRFTNHSFKEKARGLAAGYWNID